MLATLIIVFREVMEAGLVVGIVMSATRHVLHRSRWVAMGVGGGVVGACMVAAFASELAGLMQGIGQELFNAGVMTLAVLMLGWHNVWMAREGRHIAREMRTLGDDVSHGRKSLMALAIVVGIAVLREGSEVVLFLYGIALSAGDGALAMILGGIAGLALGAAVSATMYFGLLRIPTHRLFAVTSWMIALLAAGMASQAIVFLQQAGLITVWTQAIWNTSHILADSSLLGRALHTLVGYSAHPSGIQMVGYSVTLATIFILMKLFGHAPATPQAQPSRS